MVPLRVQWFKMRNRGEYDKQRLMPSHCGSKLHSRGKWSNDNDRSKSSVLQSKDGQGSVLLSSDAWR